MKLETNNATARCTLESALPIRKCRRRSWADHVSRGLWYLEYEDLCAEAVRRTGCDEIDDPPLVPALPILLNSLENEAGLRPIGRFLMRVHLRDLLRNRLRLAGAWKPRLAAMDAEPILRPIFIVGIPRSGNTFLHELLAAVSENRAPKVWEVMHPLAAGSEEPDATRFVRKTEMSLWCFRRLAPRADSVYPMRALTPHECVAIQSYTFISEEFVSTCRIPSYEAFLRSADLRPVYAWEKRFLQYLQLSRPKKRWVLKSPDHVYGLEALLDVFPDALLVQTHRNPIEVLKSSADLTGVLQGLYGRAAGPEELLARETRILAENTDRFIHFRERHPELAERIVDIRYSDLVADPLAAVQTVYAHLESTLTEADRERVRQLASVRHRYAGRRASAEPLKLRFDAGTELRRFEQYCRRFDVPFRGAD